MAQCSPAAGGIGEILGDPPVGIMVSPNDHEALAGGLEQLLSDKNKIRDLGERSRERAVQCFDMRMSIHKIENLYHEVLKFRAGTKR